jgi:hypothetical protein
VWFVGNGGRWLGRIRVVLRGMGSVYIGFWGESRGWKRYAFT